MTTDHHRRPQRGGPFGRVITACRRRPRSANLALPIADRGLPSPFPSRQETLRLARAVALAVCAAGTVGAACGRGSGSAAPAAAGSGASGSAARAASLLPDACELLTPADVEGVTREASGSLSSTLEDAVGKDPTQCSYSLGGEVPPRVISLALRRAPSAEAAAGQQQAAESGLRSMAAGAPVEELPRLGDGAFWIGGRFDQLNVRHGDTLLVFTVQLDHDAFPAARTLAGKALARLAHPAASPRPASPRGAPGATGGPPRSTGPS